MSNKTHTVRTRVLGLLTVAGLASLAACGPGGSSMDAGSEASVTPDASATPEASTMTEAGADPDASAMPETGADVVQTGDGGGFTGDTMPRVVRVSMTGHDRFWGVTYDTAGNFYAVGNVADSTEATADFRTVVAKFNASGQLDTSFGMNGFAMHNLATGTSGEVTRGIVVQPSGKIVVYATVEHAGAMDARDRDVALARFNANGTIDTTFGTGGVVTLDLSEGAVNGMNYVADTAWGLSMYTDGRLLLTGASRRMGAMDTDFALLRLSADGARDMTFGTNGMVTVDIANRSASPRNATILADGHIVMAGYYDDGGVVKPMLFKVTPTGQLDTRFGTMGIYTEQILAAVAEAYAAALQGDRFVTAGYGRNGASENIDWLSLRINANGTRDMSFGNGMGFGRYDFMGFADNCRTLVVLPDNRLIMVGGGRVADANSNAMVGMFSENGAPVASFGTNGFRNFDLGGSTDFFWGVATAPTNDRVAIVGTAAGVMGGNDDGVVYLMALPR